MLLCASQVLQVEMQRLQAKTKRDKNELAKKLEQAYLDLRSLKVRARPSSVVQHGRQRA